ncbi:c-type cytochrome [Methylobacterium soli]|uniref:C-type cytochrome n=1 Tax=Methylobacterium soli TaxID=553447 RepID=A0A6L3T4I2_9HYPH|nr:cytochrome c [Methylobacterium soli]KAB1080093.1 c-type cytochrome [Methylobacterium soli]GJE46484.1 Fructose dehydrogenase cytochrome subunit [Methylobacterium soli]
MRRFNALAATSGLISLLGIAVPPAARAADQDLIKRGEYLVTAGDCVACHTGPSGKKFAGNYVLDTPIGKIRTPNLTPDKETGLGNWTEEDFYKAFHDGISKDGSYLYPAFPFGWYTKVTKDDVKAIWAYLQSLEPVNEPRKANEIPFPFNIRTALITWRTAFFTAGEFQPDPNASAEVNRGGYLVEGLGHCGMCHNERKLVGNSGLAGKLGGGVIDGWYAPNITPNDHQGIGAWSDEQVVTYLKTGTAPGNMPGVAAGPMRQTIEESLSKMTEADLKAMVAYLRTQKARETYKVKDLEAFNQPNAPGAATYLSYCSSCHKPDGKGVEGAIPALAGNTSVQSAGPETVINVILGGLAAQSGYAPMLAIGQGMTDQEVADVTDYVRNSWGNKAPVITDRGIVSKSRDKIRTMLAGNAPCAEIAQPEIAKALQDAGAADALRNIKQDEFIPRLDSLLPKIKAAVPGAKGDDIVNGLTTAFCKVAKDNDFYRNAPWHTVIGSFSNVTYSQLHNPERRAEAPAQPPTTPRN